MALTPRSHGRLQGLAPWAGLIAGPCAWLGAQQGIADLAYVACHAGGPPIGPLIALGTAAVACLAGWVSWSGRSAFTDVRRFLCRVSAGVAAISAGGIGLVALATVMVPPCAR